MSIESLEHAFKAGLELGKRDKVLSRSDLKKAGANSLDLTIPSNEDTVEFEISGGNVLAVSVGNNESVVVSVRGEVVVAEGKLQQLLHEKLVKLLLTA